MDCQLGYACRGEVGLGSLSRWRGRAAVWGWRAHGLAVRSRRARVPNFAQLGYRACRSWMH